MMYCSAGGARGTFHTAMTAPLTLHFAVEPGASIGREERIDDIEPIVVIAIFRNLRGGMICVAWCLHYRFCFTW